MVDATTYSESCVIVVMSDSVGVELEAIRERVNETSKRYPGRPLTRDDRYVLLGLLDEAVELLTEWMDDVGSYKLTRAFLLRLGRDQ